MRLLSRNGVLQRRVDELQRKNEELGMRNEELHKMLRVMELHLGNLQTTNKQIEFRRKKINWVWVLIFSLFCVWLCSNHGQNPMLGLP